MVYCFYRIHYLRHIRDFFQVLFKVEAQTVTEEEEELRLGGEKLVLTCVGVGYSNLSKKIMWSAVSAISARVTNIVGFMETRVPRCIGLSDFMLTEMAGWHNTSIHQCLVSMPCVHLHSKQSAVYSIFFIENKNISCFDLSFLQWGKLMISYVYTHSRGHTAGDTQQGYDLKHRKTCIHTAMFCVAVLKEILYICTAMQHESLVALLCYMYMWLLD